MSTSSIIRKHDFLPAREGDLLRWSQSFITNLNSSPGPERFGISLAQAAHYAALDLAYSQAYRVATDPATSSKSNIAAKNDAKKALIANARLLARIVRANPDVTSAQRTDLGLSVADEHLTPVDVPLEAPQLRVMETMGRTVRLKIVSGQSFRKARPDGMIGALILTYVVPPRRPCTCITHNLRRRSRHRCRLRSGVTVGMRCVRSLWWPLHQRFRPARRCGSQRAG